jgi:hypothetical protein
MSPDANEPADASIKLRCGFAKVKSNVCEYTKVLIRRAIFGSRTFS